MDAGWGRTTRYLVSAAVCIGLVWLLFAAGPLLGPLVIAALLAYVLKPAVTLLTTHTRLAHNASVNLVYLLFLILLVTALVAFAPIIVTQTKRLSLELQSVRIQLESLSTAPVTFVGLDVPLGEILDEFDVVSSQLLKPERIFRVLRTATSNVVWILVIFVTAYYLLRDWERLREWLFRLVPEAYQPDARRLHGEIKDVWQAYLRGQLLLMLVVGVLTGLSSAAIGLPGVAAFGLLAGMLELIPSLGPAATAVVAAIVAWFEGSTHLPLSNGWFVVVVIALYTSIQMAENIWLHPRIMGRILRLHPGLVFVAVVGALTLAGALVALIIVPLLGTAGVVGRYVHRRVLGLQPWAEFADDTHAAMHCMDE
jgi:predicted PurR-regulated permease PerM